MGSGSDVELAKFLAEQAEKDARPVDDAVAAAEWRWSSTGWGVGGAQKRPAAEPCDDTKREPGTGDAE